MSGRYEEISTIIKGQIEKFKGVVEVSRVGVVVVTGDGVALIYGLDQAMMGELLEFDNGEMGMVLNLSEDTVGAIILGAQEKIKEGDRVKCTGRIASAPVGEALLGRVVNPLGLPLDGGAEIKTDKLRPLEFNAPSVIDRQPVKEPLQTGLKAIDSMIPIGRGQRELIIGDRQTGKTALAVDSVLNQKGKDVHCIYVSIGQKMSTVAQIRKIFTERGAMEYTTMVVAAPDDPASLLYLAPYAGCTMGEEFLYNGKHALIVYDDLSKHANAYRQLSLLLRRPPGREAYPGDVFYLHARLLERSAKLAQEKGGGSLTSLPIIETQAGDVSAYIPTNVISITDGQIYLESELFFAGIRPAVNVGISVSRVGGTAQIKAMKKVAGHLRMDMAQYRELQSFAQFTTELDKATMDQLKRGERLVEILKQDQYVPMDVAEQICIIYAGVNGHMDEVEKDAVKKFESGFLEYLRAKKANILSEIEKSKDLDEATEKELVAAIKEYKGAA